MVLAEKSRLATGRLSGYPASRSRNGHGVWQGNHNHELRRDGGKLLHIADD